VPPLDWGTRSGGLGEWGRLVTAPEVIGVTTASRHTALWLWLALATFDNDPGESPGSIA